MTETFIMGEASTAAGPIPIVGTRLRAADHLGTVSVRLGFRRMNYRVTPGLYAVGHPDGDSPVLVSANYKLSFDALRKELQGIDAWILVLDTKGVNVWCSAGKGTFSDKEIVKRIRATQLADVVRHRTVIVPQLGAPGVAAHKVREHAGFKVEYGPVRARDLRAYLKSGMRATPDMRRVHFPLVERLKLIPMEVRYAMKFAVPLAIGLGVIFMMARGPAAWRDLPWQILPALAAFIIGAAVVPALLPWIPFRSFIMKGAALGIIWTGAILAVYGGGWLWTLGNLLLIPAIAAFFSLTFTGSTTYTSPSGVNEEIRLYARPMGISAVGGLVLIIISFFAN